MSGAEREKKFQINSQRAHHEEEKSHEKESVRVVRKIGNRRDTSHDQIIRPRDLPIVTGLSRSTCWRLGNDPSSGFPPKIKLTNYSVGYSRKLIEAWLKAREENNPTS